MTTEANKAIVRRYMMDILNRRNIAALDEVAAIDYVDYVRFPEQIPGREGLRQRLTILFRALDPQWTIQDMIAERDTVVVRWTLCGTHRAEFLGYQPTGRRIAFGGVDIYRIRDGTLAEHWNVVDMLAFHQQIEVIREPERVGSRAG